MKISPAKAWKEFLKHHNEVLIRAQEDVLLATRDISSIEDATKAFIEVSARWQQCQVYRGIVDQLEATTTEEGDE